MSVEQNEMFGPRDAVPPNVWWHGPWGRVFFGVGLPVLVQVMLFLLYSLTWVDLMTGRREFLVVADGLFLDLVIVLASMFGLPAMAIPFGVVQIFSALSLGKKGASRRKLFGVGMLNPSCAILAITVISVGWLILRDKKEVIEGADWGVFGSSQLEYKN